MSTPSQSRELFGHPIGLYVCFFTELWERFSFYGMKALLFFYLTKYHLFRDDDSYDLIGAYGGLVYAVPVIGGLLADRFLGMRKAVTFGGVLLVLGHLGMAFEGVQATMKDGVVTRDGPALQALYFVNDKFLHEQAERFAKKITKESQNDEQRLDTAFTAILSRLPDDEESTLMLGYVNEMRQRLQPDALQVSQPVGLLEISWRIGVHGAAPGAHRRTVSIRHAALHRGDPSPGSSAPVVTNGPGAALTNPQDLPMI